MTNHINKNCGVSVADTSCNHCRQKYRVGRLTRRAWLENKMYRITYVDRGILFAIQSLFTHRGYMLKDYLSGKRIVDFEPLPMLLGGHSCW